MLNIKKSIVVLLLLFSTIWAEDINITQPIAYEPSAFSYNKWHEYFGLTAVGLGTVAGISGALGKANTPLHHIAGNYGAGFAVASVVSGFLIHFDDINLDYGLTDVDNSHILLALAGAAFMMLANNSGTVATPGVSPHAIFGALGTASMALSIAITW